MGDAYFRMPLFWDYTAGTFMAGLVYYLNSSGILIRPEANYLMSNISDLSTIALTLAGFILTLFTVLISFKAERENASVDPERETVFTIFFSTPLYFFTMMHLKNCIKSLVITSVVGFFLKLTLTPSQYLWLYLYNFFGLVILIMTLLRSLVILSKIVQIQKEQ